MKFYVSKFYLSALLAIAASAAMRGHTLSSLLFIALALGIYVNSPIDRNM